MESVYRKLKNIKRRGLQRVKASTGYQTAVTHDRAFKEAYHDFQHLNKDLAQIQELTKEYADNIQQCSQNAELLCQKVLSLLESHFHTQHSDVTRALSSDVSLHKIGNFRQAAKLRYTGEETHDILCRGRKYLAIHKMLMRCVAQTIPGILEASFVRPVEKYRE
eukprot:g1067.t1